MKIGNTGLVHIDDIYFKLEQDNPSGSVKDRGVLFQMEEAVKNGYKRFSISSSGNAAIAAAFWLLEVGGESLDVFASPHMLDTKREILDKAKNVVVHTTSKPNSESFRFAKKSGAFNLRASLDVNGWKGYASLGEELIRQLGGTGSLFVPVSSGTLLYGISEGLKNSSWAIHGVQTTSANFLAKSFDREVVLGEKSIADALVAKSSVYKSELRKRIINSKGYAWVITNAQIIEASNYLKSHNILTSYEGAATLAAVWRAKSESFELNSPVVCLLTGKKY